MNSNVENPNKKAGEKRKRQRLNNLGEFHFRRLHIKGIDAQNAIFEPSKLKLV